MFKKIILLIASVISLNVYAEELYQLDLTGTVEFAHSATGDLLDNVPFEAKLIYDADRIDENSNSEYGLFSNSGLTMTWSYNSGELSGTSSDLDISTRVFSIDSVFTADMFSAHSAKTMEGSTYQGIPITYTSISLESESFNGRENYFEADQIPVEFPDASAFNIMSEVYIQWGLPVDGRPPAFIIGKVESVTVSPLKVVHNVSLHTKNNLSQTPIHSNGNMKFVIDGSDVFDCGTIDPSSIRLADASIQEAGKSGKLKYKLRDMNGDGYPDFEFTVRVQSLGLSLGSNTLSLTGKTTSQDEFEGEIEIIAF